ncbi:MAG: hypothetical protein HC831_15100 [Chloroflexia bacterium]|nr:hypothetical protein [Chloroflexia bacterium]
MAKVLNVSYDDATLSAYANDLKNVSEPTMVNKITELRNSLSNTMVTGYLYSPPFGIKTVIDPNGKTTNYKYDKLGRLEWVKDDLNNLLQTYKYYYKNRF